MGKATARAATWCAARGARSDLSTVANRRKPEELKTDLTDPDETVEPRWWTLKVTRADGSVFEGLRMNEDTFTLRIMDADENLWHFSKKELRSIERIETSTMPSVTGTLTASEVDDLVAYLFSLRKESNRGRCCTLRCRACFLVMPRAVEEQ
jgi:putative heme-binding domain-containing protein